MTTIKQALELGYAVWTLIKWILVEKRKLKAGATVEKANASKDQTPIETDLNGTALGHTASDLPSVRIQPIKDRTH